MANIWLSLIILIIISQIIQTLKPSKSTPLSPYIIDGLPAARGQFPWQVGIFIQSNDGSAFCGGALISNEWVLTAAHCVEGSSFTEQIGCTITKVFSFRSIFQCFTPVSARLYLGGIDIKKRTKDSKLIQAGEIIIHSDYDSKNLKNDIALIQLKTPIQFNKYIHPIQLSNDELEANMNVIVSGWGRTADKSTVISSKLLFVPLKTITILKCSRSYHGLYPDDSKICAIGSGIKSICQGDSGGPLILPTNPPKHVGIVSFTSARGCERGYPQGFTKTAHYYNWIRENCQCI